MTTTAKVAISVLRRIAIPSLSSTTISSSSATTVIFAPQTTKINESVQQSHQFQPTRHFHKRHSAKGHIKKQACPFRALKIPKGSTYAAAKKSFLKIAMSHHPDTQQVSDSDDDVDEEEQRQKSLEIFVAARSAFERLAECSDGLAVLREEIEALEELEKQGMSDEEFDAWFLKETGHDNPFQFDLDPATMREVADMHDEVSHGLDRDGGMWHLASLVSQSVKGGKSGGSDGSAAILQLEAGDPKEDGPAAGTLGKRRKRKRVVF